MARLGEARLGMDYSGDEEIGLLDSICVHASTACSFVRGDVEAESLQVLHYFGKSKDAFRLGWGGFSSDNEKPGWHCCPFHTELLAPMVLFAQLNIQS